MQSSLNSFLKIFIAFLILSCLSINVSLAQSNGSYLKLLEGEASISSVDKKTQSKTIKKTIIRPTSSSNDGKNDGKIPIEFSFDDFMDYLKLNYIGTYFFVMRLSDKQKNEIYIFYQSNNDPYAIRTKIIEISKKN